MEALTQKAVNGIIRPPRKKYDADNLPLFLDGGDGKVYIRHPVSFANKRSQRIVGSVYHSSSFSPLNGGPCVIYLHGNASSQLEGQFLVPNVCPYGIFVFCFDFIGCGCSDGEYVSLGYFETEDTEYLIDILSKQFNMGPFILWGRSMGAATTLLCKNPKIVGKISDSAFTSVVDMCGAIASSMSLPSMFVPAVVWYLKKKVLTAANFDIETITPLNSISDSSVPAVFGHAEDDQFIPFEQCRKLYDSHPHQMKFLMVLDGGHNGKRSVSWLQLGITFILQILNIEVKNLVVSECRSLQSSDFHFSSFNDMLLETNESKDVVSLPNDIINIVQTPNVVEQPKKRHRTPEEKALKREQREQKRKEREEKKEKKRLKKLMNENKSEEKEVIIPIPIVDVHFQKEEIDQLIIREEENK